MFSRFIASLRYSYGLQDFFWMYFRLLCPRDKIWFFNLLKDNRKFANFKNWILQFDTAFTKNMMSVDVCPKKWINAKLQKRQSADKLSKQNVVDKYSFLDWNTYTWPYIIELDRVYPNSKTRTWKKPNL